MEQETVTTTKERVYELARRVIAIWEKALLDRGWQPLQWRWIQQAIADTIQQLLDNLCRFDWKESALPTLRVLRFLADQINLPLAETTEAFLLLRRPLVEALAILLGDQQIAQNRVQEIWDEGLLQLTTHRQVGVQTALEAAHHKYQALFEQASDAFILVMMDEEGTIMEANTSAASLTGYSQQELHGLPSLKLTPPEELNRYRQALQELRRNGTIRMSETYLMRKDKQLIAVDINAALLTLNGQHYALCVIRDITERKRWQERLEAIISERTKELAVALEKERYRASQMAVLAQIVEQTLEAFEEEYVFKAVVEVLDKHLQISSVALFMLDEKNNELTLKAGLTAYGAGLPDGYRQPVGVGIAGWVAQEGKPALVNDVTQDDRFQKSIGEQIIKSQLAVPIRVKGQVIGVIDLQSDQKASFDEQDLHMVHAVADQVASAIEAIRQFNRIKMLQKLNEQIVESLPDSIALLNESEEIVAVNERFCTEICQRQKDELLGQKWHQILPDELTEKVDFNKSIKDAINNGESFHFIQLPYKDRWFDIRLVPIHEAERRVMLYIRDASLRVRRLYQLETLFQISQAMESTTELNQLLHAILTAATAGPGLGFNRAILFLVNKITNTLYAVMAVGPLTQEEAHSIWTKLASERRTLWDFLKEYRNGNSASVSPLVQRVQDIVIPMENKDLLVESLNRREVIRIPNPKSEPNLHYRLREILTDSEAICVPLIVQDELLGVIIADNAFSRHPITEEAERLLRLFASSASIALRNAQLISELRNMLQREKEMKEQLALSERLAGIGEMAAKIVHDLRSPLVTIGGYIRQIERNPSDVDRIQRNVRIIINEVDRLEQLLRELLDFTIPKPPKLSKISLENLVRRLTEVYKDGFEAVDVNLKLDIAEDIPFVLADEEQMERVIINLWENAIQAMPEGGDLTVSLKREGQSVNLSVSDTGVGIPNEALANIFKPFFTTKSGGSGLGLAICKKIIDAHFGQLDVTSESGKGTTFTISLPIPQKWLNSYESLSDFS